jgi:general secretion pathway protein K
MALVTVLLFTAVAVAVVSAFIYRVYLYTARANNFRDGQRAALFARDGVDIAKAGLEAMIEADPALVIDEGGLKFGWSSDDMTISITAEDELGKAGVRVVYQATGLSDDDVEDTYMRLLDILGLDERLKDTLADWIDSDGAPRPGGAESDYYGTLETPYGAKDSDLDTLDELAMIKGYTREAVEALRGHLSVYNTDGLVNINTAGKTVIMSLSDGITEEMAERVMEWRSKTPFGDKSEIVKVDGFDTIGYALQDRVTVESDVFRVYSRAAAGDAERVIEAVVKLGGGVLYWREF